MCVCVCVCVCVTLSLCVCLQGVCGVCYSDSLCVCVCRVCAGCVCPVPSAPSWLLAVCVHTSLRRSDSEVEDVNKLITQLLETDRQVS